jgi:hypothetical protein
MTQQIWSEHKENITEQMCSSLLYISKVAEFNSFKFLNGSSLEIGAKLHCNQNLREILIVMWQHCMSQPIRQLTNSSGGKCLPSTEIFYSKTVLTPN